FHRVDLMRVLALTVNGRSRSLLKQKVDEAGEEVLTRERFEKQELALWVHLEPDQIASIRDLEIHDTNPQVEGVQQRNDPFFEVGIDGERTDLNIWSPVQVVRLDQRRMNLLTEAGDAKMFRAGYELLIDAGGCTDLSVRELIQIEPLGGEEYPSTVADGF